MVLHGCIGFYWVFTGFYRVLLGLRSAPAVKKVQPAAESRYAVIEAVPGDEDDDDDDDEAGADSRADDDDDEDDDDAVAAAARYDEDDEEDQLALESQISEKVTIIFLSLSF